MKELMDAVFTVNGVNTEELMRTISAVKAQPEIARFRFNISNRWMTGGHNRSTVKGFFGAMQEMEHAAPFVMEAGEPPVLLGQDEGANPVEYLLHALAACVTTAMVYHAAGQGIEIQSVESRIEGDLDLRGFLGIDSSVRNGYENIRMYLKIRTTASEREWNKLVRLGPGFSPVYDSIVHGVPVAIHAERV